MFQFEQEKFNQDKLLLAYETYTKCNNLLEKIKNL